MEHSTQVVHITESFAPASDETRDFVGEPRRPRDDDEMIDAKINAYDQAATYLQEQIGLLQRVKSMARRFREAVELEKADKAPLGRVEIGKRERGEKRDG